MVHAEASAELNAPAETVYRIIADYRTRHPRIIPPRYLRNLTVDAGGYGDGTLIRYDAIAFGRTRHVRARVTEPEPGRVLLESDLDLALVTTFTVDPLDGARSRLTIATDMPTHAGLAGWLERLLIRAYFKRAYAEELTLVRAETARETPHEAAH